MSDSLKGMIPNANPALFVEYVQDGKHHLPGIKIPVAGWMPDGEPVVAGGASAYRASQSNAGKDFHLIHIDHP